MKSQLKINIKVTSINLKENKFFHHEYFTSQKFSISNTNDITKSLKSQKCDIIVWKCAFCHIHIDLCHMEPQSRRCDISGHLWHSIYIILFMPHLFQNLILNISEIFPLENKYFNSTISYFNVNNLFLNFDLVKRHINGHISNIFLISDYTG